MSKKQKKIKLDAFISLWTMALQNQSFFQIFEMKILYCITSKIVSANTEMFQLT